MKDFIFICSFYIICCVILYFFLSRVYFIIKKNIDEVKIKKIYSDFVENFDLRSNLLKIIKKEPQVVKVKATVSYSDRPNRNMMDYQESLRSENESVRNFSHAMQQFGMSLYQNRETLENRSRISDNNGDSGYSGYRGAESGYSGISFGASGYSGISGIGISSYSDGSIFHWGTSEPTKNNTIKKKEPTVNKMKFISR
jgi:hypothetical protein